MGSCRSIRSKYHSIARFADAKDFDCRISIVRISTVGNPYNRNPAVEKITLSILAPMMGNRSICSTLRFASIDLGFFLMKGERFYFPGKLSRASVSEPF